MLEPILEPERVICDPHHHLWDVPPDLAAQLGEHCPMPIYLFSDFAADLSAGHRVQSTVYIEAHAFYREDAPSTFRSVGESEFAVGMAAMSASGRYGAPRIAAGIVCGADLSSGRETSDLLEAHLRVAGSRLKGVRNCAALDASPAVADSTAFKGLYASSSFREGLGLLAGLDLSFDAYLFHHQLDEMFDLARAFPNQSFVLDHLGCPLGVGPYAGRRAEVFAVWREHLAALADCDNVLIKIGGLGMAICGFNLDRRHGSGDVAQAWRPYIETAVELFGPDRCMFESNYPADAGSCSYQVLWNAFKIVASQYSASEKDALFCGTAERAYRLVSPPT